MRYSVSCGLNTIVNGKKNFEPKYVHNSVFDDLECCFSFLSREYQEAKFNRDIIGIKSVFEWVIFDFYNKEIYLYSFDIDINSKFLDFFSDYIEFKKGTINLRVKELKSKK